jgi:hypothetical protein
MKRTTGLFALLGYASALLVTGANPAPAAGMDQAGTDQMAGMYHRTSYRGTPDLALAVSLVTAGGGPEHFDAGKLIGVLAGPNTDAEVAKLTKQYGAENVKAFLSTFTYAINDTLKFITAHKIALPSPSPDPTDGKALSAALYKAGIMPDGRFDIGYMLEHAISHEGHVAIMKDMNEDPSIGPRTNAMFHVILTQAMKDLKAAYGL